MITAKEVAILLGVSTGAVYDLAAPKGPIPCVRLGRRCIRFNEADIEAFKQSRTVSQVPPQPGAKMPMRTVLIEVSPHKMNCFERRGLTPKPKLVAKRNKP